jgi:hypothetical protein
LFFGLLVAGLIGLASSASWGRSASPPPAVPLPQPQENPRVQLRLSDPELIAGTQMLRAEMQSIEETGGLDYKSGTHAETRNVLFVDTTSGATRWLLPSHSRVLSETAIPPLNDPYATPIALAEHVKDEGAPTGELFVCSATGTKLVQVATGVSRVHSAAAAGPSEFVVLFERNGRFVMTRFANATLAKLSEHELKLPPVS